MLDDASGSKTQTFLDELRRGHPATRVSSPEEDAATAQQLIEKWRIYWNLSLPSDCNPLSSVRNGLKELLLLVEDILLQKKFRISCKFDLIPSDDNTQIKSMYREMDKTMNLLRHAWNPKMRSELVRDLQGNDRTEFRKILDDFNVYRLKFSELSRLISRLQTEIFDLGLEVLVFKERRAIRVSSRLRCIAKRCSINALSPRSMKPYYDLMIVRYMRSNGVEAPINAWWSVQEVLSDSDALHKKLRGLRDFWETTGLMERFSGRTRVWHFKNVKTEFARLYQTLMRSLKELDRALVWYMQELVRQWARSSPDQTASAIPRLEDHDRYNNPEKKNHALGQETIDATDYNCFLGRAKAPELAHSDPSCEFCSSDPVVGLSIRATPKLAQQYVSSLARSALRMPQDFWINPPDSAGASTNTGRPTSKQQGLDDIVKAEGTALSDSKTDVPVEVIQKLSRQHLSPLGYHMPAKTLADAKLACPSTRASYWQYTLYQSPTGEKVKVHYCKSKATTERIAQLFVDEEVLGFDIEWKPQALATEGIKKNVALMQIASEERIALFHIARYWEDEKIDDLVAPTLKKIMESPKITKVGVSIKADCTRLRKFMGIDSRGLLELSHLYKLVKFSQDNVKMINKKLVSLSQQVEEHLQLPMWKGEVRSSDWSQELDYEQIYCKSLNA